MPTYYNMIGKINRRVTITFTVYVSILFKKIKLICIKTVYLPSLNIQLKVIITVMSGKMKIRKSTTLILMNRLR